jgi:hypothetical protein
MYTHSHSPAYNFLQDGPMVTVTEDRVGELIAPAVVRAESGRLPSGRLRHDGGSPVTTRVSFAIEDGRPGAVPA